jgi:hypothetical protein
MKFVDFAIARGANPTDIKAAVSSATAKGAKIWEILDPMCPTNGHKKSMMDDIAEWAKEKDAEAAKRMERTDDAHV